MKYSVIIPVKNNPEQVRRCIQTIPESSNIEVLVCDDHSDPEPLQKIRKICDEYPGIRFFEADKSYGAGRERNVGLETACGEWLIFSDSDDFFDKDFWNELNPITEKSDADIIYFTVKGVESDTLKPVGRGRNYSMHVENFVDGKKNAEERLRFYHMVPWGKVIRRSFVEEHHIRFDEVRASNDVMFCIKAGSLAHKIEGYKILMYYVTVSNNSLTKKKDKELLRCRYDVLIRHYKYVMSLGKPQCAYNMFKFAVRYSRPYGFGEFLFYLKKMVQNRINPFIVLYKIGRYD